jgi:carotenoid cleavage dioxygenase
LSNFFLKGNFAPVYEERTVTDLTVTGHIPDYLDGQYVRNGPNPVTDVDPDAYHWFTGDGMVHGVRLRDGRAEWYRNRWVRSPAMAARLGEPYDGERSGFLLPDVGANTNVIGHAGRMIALAEAGAASFELGPDLSTAGAWDFGGAVAGGYTAHPKRDPDSGDLHAISYQCGGGNRVRYSVIDTAGEARRTTDIETGGAAMMHDFSLTDRHVVLYDLPVTYDPLQAAEVAPPATNGRFPYRWDPEYPARIGVMPRSGESADTRWFEIAPCFILHALNAYDDGDAIVADVIRYDKLFDTDFTGPSEGRPTLYRWRVDLPSGKVGQEQLDDRVQEFPQVDERLTGRRHRYGYAPRFLEGPGELLKHDLERGEDIVCSFGDGRQPGEFVFVPRSDDAAEDDGVLIGFVYQPADDRSSLEILDAATLETVATVRLPLRVPNGFHGNWIPAVMSLSCAGVSSSCAGGEPGAVGGDRARTRSHVFFHGGITPPGPGPVPIVRVPLRGERDPSVAGHRGGLKVAGVVWALAIIVVHLRAGRPPRHPGRPRHPAAGLPPHRISPAARRTSCGTRPRTGPGS